MNIFRHQEIDLVEKNSIVLESLLTSLETFETSNRNWRIFKVWVNSSCRLLIDSVEDSLNLEDAKTYLALVEVRTHLDISFCSAFIVLRNILVSDLDYLPNQTVDSRNEMFRLIRKFVTEQKSLLIT